MTPIVRGNLAAAAARVVMRHGDCLDASRTRTRVARNTGYPTNRGSSSLARITATAVGAGDGCGTAKALAAAFGDELATRSPSTTARAPAQGGGPTRALATRF